MNNLKKPLTLEEEQELARRNYAGSIETRNQLVEHNLRYILSLTNSIGRGLSYDDLQELRSHAMEKALKSADGFKPQGVKFISYLKKFLPKELRVSAYKLRHNVLPDGSIAIRLNQYPVSSKPTGKATHADEEGWGKHLWEEMIDSSSLNPEERYEIEARQKLAIRSYFFEDKSLAQIANELGLGSREGARQLKNKGLKTLRYKLKRYGYEDDSFYTGRLDQEKILPPFDLDLIMSEHGIAIDSKTALNNYANLVEIGIGSSAIRRYPELIAIPTKEVWIRYRSLKDSGLTRSYIISNPLLILQEPKNKEVEGNKKDEPYVEESAVVVQSIQPSKIIKFLKRIFGI